MPSDDGGPRAWSWWRFAAAWTVCSVLAVVVVYGLASLTGLLAATHEIPPGAEPTRDSRPGVVPAIVGVVGGALATRQRGGFDRVSWKPYALLGLSTPLGFLSYSLHSSLIAPRVPGMLTGSETLASGGDVIRIGLLALLAIGLGAWLMRARLGPWTLAVLTACVASLALVRAPENAGYFYLFDDVKRHVGLGLVYGGLAVAPATADAGGRVEGWAAWARYASGVTVLAAGSLFLFWLGGEGFGWLFG